MRQDIIPFFQDVKLSKSATSVQACYLELAQQVPQQLKPCQSPSMPAAPTGAWSHPAPLLPCNALPKTWQQSGRRAANFVHPDGAQAFATHLQVREKLGPLDAYFGKLADAMEVWIAAWDQLNPAPVAQKLAQPQENGVAATSHPAAVGRAAAKA